MFLTRHLLTNFLFWTTLAVRAQSLPDSNVHLATEQINPHLWTGFSIGGTVSGYGNLCDTYRLGVVQSARRKEFKASLFNFDLLVGYQKNGWRLETGHGFGASGIVRVAVLADDVGASTWFFPLSRVPLRVYRRQSLGQSRFAVAPMVGLLYTFWWPMMRGSYSDYTQPRIPKRPEMGNERLQFYDLGRYHSISYELGSELSYSLNRETVFTLRAHYTNTFSPDYVARMVLSYDINGIEQPAYVSQSKLEAWVLAAGVQFRLARSPESYRQKSGR